jgi:hypothetical protein
MSDWCTKYAVDELPPPPPSPADRVALRADAGPDNPYPVADAWLRAARSMVDYLNPWPSAKTRAQIQTPLDGVKCAACWLFGRVEFLERLAGLTERWDLYAPSVDKFIVPIRVRLSYSDGSEIVLRQRAEPADFTHFTHWFEEKIVNYEYLVAEKNPEYCWGYCNLLAHQHARNPAGASLVRIVLFRVYVELVPPGNDALVHYQEQNRLTQSPPRSPNGYGSDRKLAAAHVLPDFYEFDPLTKTGWQLEPDNP